MAVFAGKRTHFGLLRGVFLGAIAVILAACDAPSGPKIEPVDPPTLSALQNTTPSVNPLFVTYLPPVTNRGVGHPHLIDVGDLLEVDVYQEDSLDKTVRVDSTGQILLPLIGTTPAAGRTIQGLARTLESKYRGSHLQDPEITVFIAETREPKITVDGAVENPGLYPVNEDTTLLQVIASVGGFTDLADPSRVYVFRDYFGQKLVANYSVTAIREGRIADLKIFEGDTIVSFQSNGKVALRNAGQVLGIAAVLATITRQ